VTRPIPGLGGRREAREEALAVLYEVAATGTTVADALAARPVSIEAYGEAVATGVEADLRELDELISRHLTGWRLERLAVVDRLLLRMATWELRGDDVPTGVVLSEAVELATQYCGEESPRFVNGVLRAIADEVRAEEASADQVRADDARPGE
jgi:N utilization substance protein B